MLPGLACLLAPPPPLPLSSLHSSVVVVPYRHYFYFYSMEAPLPFVLSSHGGRRMDDDGAPKKVWLGERESRERKNSPYIKRDI